jgi:serine/threonine-protein kinase
LLPELPMAVTTHPSLETLAAFVRGDLPPAELSAVAEHVGACDSCCAALRAIPDDTFGNLARAAAVPAVTTPDPVGDLSPPEPAKADNIPADLAAHPRYKILKELGAGGMGVVYKAEDRVMQRLVALKVMASHLTAKAGAVERFNKEVIAAARLEHQNIVRAYDKGEAGNLHFLVMEYLEGESLDHYVARKGPLPVHLACAFIRQAANGLQHAAEKGLTHRDIKPQNLMVLRKGQIKVMDFGLARFVRNEEEEAAAPAGRLPFGAGKPVSDPLTNPNLIMGTPDYLSPEQARNSHAVDHRSDIYSLGCTLYFLLTGKPPFAHESSLIDKLLGHTEGKVPSLRKARPDVPEGLIAVIKKMMAKKPDDRFQSASDVAVVLQPFTRPDAAPEVIDAVVVAPVAAVSTVPPVLTLPNPEPAPAPTKSKSRPELAHKADTAPNPDQPTLVESERPRKAKKAKKPQLIPWWKQKWAKIGAAALAGVMIVAIVLAAGGKKEQPPPPDGGDNTANKDKQKENPGTGGPSPKDKQNTGTNPFRPGQTGGSAYDKSLPLLYVVPSRGLWRDDYDPVVDVLKQGGVKIVTVSGDGGKSTLQGDPKEGIPVDKKLDEVNAVGFSGVVFCGFRIDEYIGDGKHSEKVAQLIKDMREQGKPVTAICVGVGVLASHDVLEGKVASRSPALIEYYPAIADRVNWVNARVHPTRDTRNPASSPVITAGMARDAKDFAETLLKLYKKD